MDKVENPSLQTRLRAISTQTILMQAEIPFLLATCRLLQQKPSLFAADNPVVPGKIAMLYPERGRSTFVDPSYGSF